MRAEERTQENERRLLEMVLQIQCSIIIRDDAKRAKR